MKNSKGFSRYFAIWAAFLVLFGCQSAGPRPVQPPAYHADWSSALNFIVEDFSGQITDSRLSLPKSIPVDLFFDEKSAEEVAAAKTLQQQVIAAMGKKFPGTTFVPVSTRSIQGAEWVLLASYANLKADEAGKPGAWVRLRMAFAEIKSGATLTKTTTYLDMKQFSAAPSRFYKDAPMYLADNIHTDRTAVMGGTKRSLTDSLALRAKISEAVEIYEAGKYAEAESLFKSILETSPNHPGSLSGLYQALWRQGKVADATRAFERLMASGFESGKISLKLLFRLGSTEFVDDADLSQQYAMWIKVLAKVVVDKKHCLDVVGHASASGTTETNNRLSLSRATAIVGKLQQANRAAGAQLKAVGKGAAETIVGTGANDASDAIDRRVEFSVRSCQ